mmetsp:Transcript_4564/g.8803  ORF Transcript_4564/g.8803 Transcript_4564/m.8803 type:complete len:292 (-) Transcript_4564:183-1058(-)
MKIQNLNGISFKGAEGCHDASDYLVRAFVVRLKQGILVKMHPEHSDESHFPPSSSWSASSPSRTLFSRLKKNFKSTSPQPKILCLHSDGISLTWKHQDDGKFSSSTKRRKTNKNVPNDKLFDLRTCMEVRHHHDGDDFRKECCMSTEARNVRCFNQGMTFGRSSPCKSQDEDERKTRFLISLVFPDRTLKFTAYSDDQFGILIQGFSALCYRLQLASHFMKQQQKLQNSRDNQEEEKILPEYGEDAANSTMDTFIDEECSVEEETPVQIVMDKGNSTKQQSRSFFCGCMFH